MAELERSWTAGFGFRNSMHTTRESLSNAVNSLYDDSEGAWASRLRAEISRVKKKGVQGDIPAPPGFAAESSFWRTFMFTGAFGVLFGLVDIVFLMCAEKVPKLWVRNYEFETYEEMKYYSGEKYYILLCCMCGLGCGLLRVILKYPDTIPGLFKEIESCHVNPATAPATILISAISLGGGASLGPEQALGNLGGGFATYLVENWIEFPFVADRKMFVLCGMCASFGGLFPTPVLASLLIYELGQPPKPFMESIILLSLGSFISYIFYQRFCSYFYLDKLVTKGEVIAALWDFELSQCGIGLIIGVISGALCLIAVVMIGVFRQVFNRLRERLNERGIPGKLVAPVIGGVVIGCVGWVLPLTLGDGNLAISPVIHLTLQQVQSGTSFPYSSETHINPRFLLSCAFAKMFTLAVSMQCGFVGGFVLPMITVGVFCGCAMNLIFPNLDTGLCLGCFMAAVPAGICPMPFTLLGIAVYPFFFGFNQTIPIFIALITSYTVLCGSGLFKRLADRGESSNTGSTVESVEQRGVHGESELAAYPPSATPAVQIDNSDNPMTLEAYGRKERKEAESLDYFNNDRNF